MLTKILSSILSQNFTNVKIFKDFNALVHKAIESSRLKPKPEEPLFIFKIELDITILYVIVTLLLT